jgi:hypothetical protein
MTRDEIREAITGPVAVSGATISDRLVTRLLNDINNDTDQLPVLQHAMMRTWDAWYKRNQHDTPIDFDDYEKIGTMKTALSLHADEAYTEAAAAKNEKACELMFKALTDKAADPRGTRRPRNIADLCLLTGAQITEVTNVVEIFRKPGRTFLMPPYGIELKEDSIIDISHESLMRVWERLVKWADEESRSGDIYLRLAESAQLKDLNQRGFLKDPELELALKWKEKNNPSAKWAEGFQADFARAMAYLDESRVEDLADKKAKARLAEEKLNEEKKAAKRKLKNMIFALMIFSLIGAGFSIFRLYVLINNVRKSAKNATRQKEIADSSAKVAIRQKEIADSSRNVAISLSEKADSIAKYAMGQKEKADSSAKDAMHQKIKADSSAKYAMQQKAKADSSATEAKDQKEIAYNNSLKNAASVYARLIREGPYAKQEIRDSAFDYKLVAYTEHLDTLGPLIKERIKNRYTELEYNNLLEKLYYNNDLYEKIYSCLSVTDPNAKKTLFDGIPYAGKFSGDYDSTNSNFKKINDALANSGQRLIKIIKSDKDKLIFCSTNDNWIYVYRSGSNTPENKIAMGAMATAIDYNAENDIIYFGLESGDIGSIKYNKDRKNQPVFENALNTPITAVQFFMFRSALGINKGISKPFLLVAGKRSKVIVYELADNNPLPDRRLLGNILPERNLVDVTNARFDGERISIEVKSSKPGTRPAYYSWNPFTAEAFDEYKKYKNWRNYKTRYWSSTKYY